jgi:hypothetical protein
MNLQLKVTIDMNEREQQAKMIADLTYRQLTGQDRTSALPRRGERSKMPVPDRNQKIWQLEDWGPDEWKEQTRAEMAFAIAMDIEFTLDTTELDGRVADFRVRRAPNGLILVPADSDDDIFVAVKVDVPKAVCVLLGWLRGREGKVPQFYRGNRWVVQQDALHDMEDLPNRERLRSMPPFKLKGGDLGN